MKMPKKVLRMPENFLIEKSMNAYISPLMRKIMNDPVACKQLMAALDPFYDNESERPKVVFEGKTYDIKTSGGIELTQKADNV